MVNYKYAELYTQDSIDKQVKIEYDGGTITNEELFSESIELSESLCSESELRFGCCEASVLKFKVANIMMPLKDKWLEMNETLAGNTDVPFRFGQYKVFSDKPTADRRYRDIVAYDAMYDIINAEMADWYNALLPDEDSTVTMKEFRTSFIEHFGLEQKDVELINDDMVVEKTIEPSEISGKDIITAICEINGCFGHIGRDGKFHYVLLPKYAEGLYPANDLYPADDLYPRDPKSMGIGKSYYTGCQFEDFVTKSIDKLQIRQEENDIGAVVGTGTNCYIIEDNFLVYGKGAEDLENIANNVLSVISGVRYHPAEVDAKGNPCFEVGDAIRLATKYEIVETYILSRTLKGIQALRDSYSAEGVEEYAEKVNSFNRQIIQLKGKTNILERTVEMTRSEIADVEEGLKSTITQTADEIRLEIEDTKKDLESSITQTAESIKTEVSAKYETKTDAESQYKTLSSSITQTASKIKSEVSATYETQSDAKFSYSALSSSITQTASEIRSEVSGTYQSKNSANAQYSELSSSISQTAEQISTKVSKDNIVSEINQSAEGIKISAELLELVGNMQMTGGSINIIAADVANSIIHLGRGDTNVDMGTDGFRSTCTDGRETTISYGGISVGYSNGSSIVSITPDGNIQAVNGVIWGDFHVNGLLTLASEPVITSDKELKNSIEELNIEDTAKFIYSLNPCRFKYNNGTSGRYHHGLIAQEVKEAMGENDWGVYVDGEYNSNNEEEEYKGLRYGELIADLIATVQSQNERIKALEERMPEYEQSL